MKIFNVIKDFASRRSPEICIAAGIAGMAGSVIFAVRGTIKAKAVVEETKEELDVEELPKKAVIGKTWKYYIPAFVSFALSTTLIILADHKHNKRNAALSVTCAGLETTINAYKDKMFETLGEKKTQKIVDAVAQDKLDKNPIVEDEVIPTGKGDTIIYDVISGRYFRSSLNEVDRVINEINKRLLCHDFVTLNDLYYELGLPSIGIGKELGWNMSDDFINRDKSEDDHYGTTTNGEPCKILDYLVYPRFRKNGY